MEQIYAQFIIDIGLIADYGSICLDLLRKFDVHSKDPSTTRKLIRQWVEQVDSLFRGGNIFRAAPSTAAGMYGPIAPLAPCTQKTATQIALEQIQYISEVDYVGRVRDFMAASPKDLIQRGMEQMHAVVGPAKEASAHRRRREKR